MKDWTQRPRLTEEEKRKIWEIIYRNMRGDDRYPGEVIHDRYGGDEEEYLRVMAKYYEIPIGKNTPSDEPRS